MVGEGVYGFVFVEANVVITFSSWEETVNMTSEEMELNIMKRERERDKNVHRPLAFSLSSLSPMQTPASSFCSAFLNSRFLFWRYLCRPWHIAGVYPSAFLRWEGVKAKKLGANS